MAQAVTEEEKEEIHNHSSDSGIHNDLTTCPICFETFKRPKHLPCLHSFCEACLQSYIDSAKTKVKEDTEGIPGIVCPLCRLFVEIPDGCQWNEWANSLPMNHLLASVIEADGAKKSKVCNTCARENESKNATVWCMECVEGLCEQCEHQHRRLKYVANHRLIDIGDMDQLQQSVISQVHEIMCSTHPKKALEAYCEDHSAVCCLTCAMLNHRKCEQVGTIENAAQEKKKKGEDTALKQSFVEMRESLISAKEAVDGNLMALKEQVADIESSIHKAYDDFIKHGQKLRDEKLQELRSLEKSLVPAAESKRDEISGKICALENDLKVLSTTVDLAPDTHFLLNFNRLLEQKSAIQIFLEKEVLQQTKLSEMKFENSSALFSLSGVIDSFGEMVVETRDLVCGKNGIAKDPGPKVVDLTQMKPKLKHIVSMEGKTIIGIGLLGDNIVIIADESKAVELLDMKGTHLSTMMLDSCAADLKILPNSNGAVVEKEKITFFKVQNKSLKMISQLKIPQDTRAFDYFDPNLYISDETKISINNMNRKTSSYIELRSPMFHFAVRSDGNVVYTNDENDQISCIRSDGSEVWQYSHDNLKYTYGIAIDNIGNVLVCGKKTNNVYLLTHSGKFHRQFLKLSDSSEPRCVSINENECKVAVGCTNMALVYDLK